MRKQMQWIIGINAVSAALAHDAHNVHEILMEANASNPRLAEIEGNARRLTIELRKVTGQALDGVAGRLRHQGVAARYAAAQPLEESELPALIAAANGRALVLVLDGVQDPHNLGACLRSAAAAGAHAVVIPKDKAVQITATVRKTSAGAADRVPVVSVTNLARCLKSLKSLGVWIYGLTGTAETLLYARDLTGNVALVLGGEADGLRRLTANHCDQLTAIPMPGLSAGVNRESLDVDGKNLQGQNFDGQNLDSLNVSVATGIALFEAVRQRQSHGDTI